MLRDLSAQGRDLGALEVDLGAHGVDFGALRLGRVKFEDGDDDDGPLTLPTFPIAYK